MATYTKLPRKKGTSWRAQVRIRRDGVIVHSEAKTFSSKTLAKSWAERRERELEDPQAAVKAQHGRILLKTILLDYIEEVGAEFGRTKRKSIEKIATYEIAETPVGDLTSEKLLAHIRWRRQTAAPSTAGNDLIWIKGALEHAKCAWGKEIDLTVIEDARSAAHRARLIGKSNERDRRPTPDELERLRGWFSRSHVGPGKSTGVPMNDIMDFAIASARRQAEITRLEWRDLDQDRGVCRLRDAKSPHGSKGNHRPFALTKEALAIIKRQPKNSPYIFPYQAKTVGAYFTKACQMLAIEDLRFHDLRHEATSRLFEAGYQIHQVQQFTLHERWDTLQRYTQLKAEDVANR
jgi:integrase